jgi:hypothetical protein
MDVGTILRLSEPRGAEYDVCEVVGRMEISEGEFELVLADASGAFCPTFLIAADQVWRLYDVDHDETIALAERRAAEAAKAAAEMADRRPAMPWEALS